MPDWKLSSRIREYFDGNPARILLASRLWHIAGSRWGERRYLKVERLDEPEGLAAEAVQEA